MFLKRQEPSQTTTRTFITHWKFTVLINWEFYFHPRISEVLGELIRFLKLNPSIKILGCQNIHSESIRAFMRARKRFLPATHPAIRQKNGVHGSCYMVQTSETEVDA